MSFHRLKYSMKGGALYFSILVILLLTLISSGFILLNRLWYQENTLFLKNTELNDNIDSAAEWLKVQPDLIAPGETQKIDLYGDSSFVTVHVERWGLLRLAKFSATWRNLNHSRAWLFSEVAEHQPALYLTDNNRFLSLVGKCFIKGDCFLPPLGIRAGEIDGITFTGQKLIDGTIHKSGNKLPELSEDVLSPWSGYWHKQYKTSDSIVGIFALTRDRKSSVSFSSKTLLIDCDKKVFLQNIDLTGNIIVVATDTLVVTPTAKLEDILLFAGTIIVADQVKGNFQMFARNKIAVGQNCLLSYPSFAVCFSESKPAEIFIGKNSTLSGGLLLHSPDKNTESTRLQLSEGDRLTGTVYVNGKVGFAGRIDGSLYCNNFFIDSPRAYYENFLKEAILESGSIPAGFGSFVINGDPDNLNKIKLAL